MSCLKPDSRDSTQSGSILIGQQSVNGRLQLRWLEAEGTSATSIDHTPIQPNEVQTIRPGGIIKKGDVSVAKNYLTEDELQVLHRIVNLYIEYAELQALERRAMTMQEWVDKLDDFLMASGRALLDHTGKVSAEAAKAKAEQEYGRYQAFLDTQPRAIDGEFEKVAKQLQKPAATRKKSKGRK